MNNSRALDKTAGSKEIDVEYLASPRSSKKQNAAGPPRNRPRGGAVLPDSGRKVSTDRRRESIIQADEGGTIDNQIIGQNTERGATRKLNKSAKKAMKFESIDKSNRVESN